MSKTKTYWVDDGYTEIHQFDIGEMIDMVTLLPESHIEFVRGEELGALRVVVYDSVYASGRIGADFGINDDFALWAHNGEIHFRSGDRGVRFGDKDIAVSAIERFFKGGEMRANQKKSQGKGSRPFATNHLTDEQAQKNHEDIFGKKKPWWEIRDEEAVKMAEGEL